MKKSNRMLRICLLVLLMAVFWRCIGAPVSAKDFQSLQTEFWQARELLSSRIGRVFSWWICSCETAKAEMIDGTDVISVYVSDEKRVVDLPLEEYVFGVTAAEMPAQYHLEALKAQMVAARTRTLWQIEQGGCSKHPGTDICTDSTHCQGYFSEDDCKEKWGESYLVYRQRLMDAQRATEGEWIAYEGKPITVLYHAISGGKTENAETVFLQHLPYLVSVESGGEEQVAGYQQESFFQYEEIAEKMNVQMPDHELTAEEIRRTFSVLEYTESGRVKYVQLGSAKLDGSVLRELLGLRSTWFSISLDDKGITFYQKGYGHGVGMSQAGANAMAASGADYRQILEHYYTGVTLCK